MLAMTGNGLNDRNYHPLSIQVLFFGLAVVRQLDCVKRSMITHIGVGASFTSAWYGCKQTDKNVGGCQNLGEQKIHTMSLYFEKRHRYT